jgi:UDP-N-acetylmuramate dehydrogenase
VVFQQVPLLASLTTFGIGGKAEEYCRVATPEKLIEVVAQARAARQPYCLLAGGSNVVLPEYLPGLLIHYRARANYAPTLAGGFLLVEAGCDLAKLITFAIKNNLAGLEALSGIPGSVGGAIVGNAGAYGQSISDKLVAVEIYDGKQRRWLTKKQCRFAYRDSIFKHQDYLVLRAKFKLASGNKKLLAKKSREIIKIREQKYQPGLKCPGSFFKNVLVKNISKKSLKLINQTKIIDGKIPAGYLLQEVGAKNVSVGDLMVADFHGNLLINTGAATMADVQKLAKILKQKVFKKFGIKLAEEVRYLGIDVV